MLGTSIVFKEISKLLQFQVKISIQIKDLKKKASKLEIVMFELKGRYY